MSASSSTSSASSAPSLLASSALFASGLVGGAALYAAYERRRRRLALASTKPLNPMDPTTMHDSAAGMVDVIVKYHQTLQRRDDGPGKYAVRTSAKPGSILAQLPTSCPEKPESYDAIFRDCERIILPGLTHWSSPNFFGYFKTFGSEPSALADLLCASINVVGFSWVAAPAATELEIAMCDWMAKLLQLPDTFLSTSPGGGVIQGTASDSLLCAMIAARNRALQGLTGDARVQKASRLVVYVSDQTHSIGEKGCLVLDLPHLRVIPTRRDAADVGNYGLHPDDLDAAMAKDVAAGLVPFLLVPTVGTTSTTAIDPLPALIKVARAQKEPVWVHLDGAYGGAAALCPEYRHWLQGVEDVDSFCINPHKWLLIPSDCSLLWVRDRRPLIQALALDPEYLKNDFMSQVQYKDWQVALGRRFRSLKLWFTMRRFGADGLRTHIRRSIDFTKRAETLLVEDGRFTIFTPVRMALVCFYVSFGGRALNEALLRKVNDDGKIFLVHSVVDGVHFLRLSFGGLEVDAWHVDNGVKVLTDALNEIVDGDATWRAAYDAFRRDGK
jgi:aromatic-L-amino-acid/L-tryptophan decarboxylase